VQGEGASFVSSMAMLARFSNREGKIFLVISVDKSERSAKSCFKIYCLFFLRKKIETEVLIKKGVSKRIRG
jgi:hypothetical protein